jgi:protein SCO1
MTSTALKSKAAGRTPPKSKGRGGGKSGSTPKLPLVPIGLGFVALFAAFVAFTSLRPAPAPPTIGGPFVLTAQNGQPVSDRDLLGRPFLVFFGYTHCPDVCHTTLFEMSEILRAMGPDAKIGALFVTVDPERDSPEVLKDYLANFDERIVGLTGRRPALDPMLKEYRIYSKNVPTSNGEYFVDHTTVVYLMDKTGQFVNAFNVSRKPADAARDLQRYL